MYIRKKVCSVFLIFLFLLSQITYAYGETTLDLVSPSVILVEQSTGKVLYKKDEHKKMYPASMTKILTALVALDYLNPEELYVAGPEVNGVPYDSSKAGHKNGETLKGENLIRGLIIPSGNETACIVASAVAKKITGNESISYDEAEKTFSDLMNEKAKSLGALESNFVNPHGYHNDHHYTTAYDMALISRAGMENELIKKIAAEKVFSGNGAGENPSPDLKTQMYEWKTHNALISGEEDSYPYATGLKTGFTDEAGDCVSASAEKDNKKLIAIVFNSKEPGRWQDAVKLFDYGFNTFAYETVQEKGSKVGEMPLSNHKLGESETIEVYAKDEFIDFLSKDEASRIMRSVVYSDDYIAPVESEEEGAVTELKLKAPIVKDAVLGTVTYTLDGEKLHEGDILASSDVEERTFKSDFKYYTDKVKSVVFSLKAIPFWIGGIVLIVVIVLVISSIKKRRNRNFYKLNKRY